MEGTMRSFMIAAAALALAPVALGCGDDEKSSPPYMNTPDDGGAEGGYDVSVDVPVEAAPDVPKDTPKDTPGECKSNCTNKQCGADDGCGNKCQTGTCPSGSVCQSGFCCNCTAGQTCCAGQCVSLGKDDANCGKCGTACSGQKCIGGACGTSTPDCNGKDCGPDGAGSLCGTCPANKACVSAKCTDCTPLCKDKECGPNNCGGVCGTCAAGKKCNPDGKCVACSADCGGKQCGEDDGCGGACKSGPCAGGGTCQDGKCVGGCTPDCSGKTCGPDGCGGLCGTCTYPELCQPSGACACKPDCTTAAKQCGYDACFGKCGDCGAATPVCNAKGMCGEDPKVVGCSDGTREGFKDKGKFTGIAGCQAQWPKQSMRTSSSLVACGNDLGPCLAPEDACAEGWHICMKNGWPGDLTDRTTRIQCRSADSGDGPFLGASDFCNKHVAPLECGGAGWSGTNYYRRLACCGLQCPVDNYTWSPYWTSDTPFWDVACNESSSQGNLGVLCCKNPEITGH
jgi:hypothetical protein